ncbi:alpha-ketoacid dehydrogenase subunit alpha/beta [Urechidicola sp. KH5]
MGTDTSAKAKQLSFNQFKEEILNDYRIAVLSRACSLLGRKEVLTGKAKFGIFGDGKELPQIAMAKAFQKGDFRSGYYRDQTFMMAIGMLTPQQLFAGLYAHTDIEEEPFSAGRQMGAHYASHSLNADGSWKNLTEQYNISADMSATASQMPRLVGLAQASKVYRELDSLKDHANKFSKEGNEIAWGTIGNASTSEGLFFETINAAGVLQVPIIVSVWDDEYGISVHQKHHTTKESISAVLKGFEREEDLNGFEIFTVEGWDYVQLMDVYTKAARVAREEHVPVLIHVTELTQPQGHSTSGSHERYKSKERLQWEKDFDCNAKMREWILDFELEADGETLRLVENEDELIAIEKTAKKEASVAKRDAWKAYIAPIKKEQHEAVQLLHRVAEVSSNKVFIEKLVNDLKNINEPERRDIFNAIRTSLVYLTNTNTIEKKQLLSWFEKQQEKVRNMYNTFLYAEDDTAATKVPMVAPTFDPAPQMVDGRIIIRDNFEALFKKYSTALAFGEDVGKIGDVNQGMEGLQDKFGEIRVADTGIREPTIIGQGVGMALRGLRPIAEIQYLDYLVYALQTLTDDLACLRYRTFGKQTAPLIIRTRGHRLEGIWHSGSPISMILGALRGVVVLVPRNMQQAAGFYNTLFQCEEPALVIESLNGYRLKEALPTNLGEFTVPIGKVETLREGSDITIVSYGSTLRIVQETATLFTQAGIDIEIIDAQSLLPFDLDHDISKSLAKTNRLMVVDEDVPGGGTAYMMQEILETQNGYQYLDSKPVTVSSKAHRPAYGSDGDYYSKPNSNDIFEAGYAMMHESNPTKFPKLF